MFRCIFTYKKKKQSLESLSLNNSSVVDTIQVQVREIVSINSFISFHLIVLFYLFFDFFFFLYCCSYHNITLNAQHCVVSLCSFWFLMSFLCFSEDSDFWNLPSLIVCVVSLKLKRKMWYWTPCVEWVLSSSKRVRSLHFVSVHLSFFTYIYTHTQTNKQTNNYSSDLSLIFLNFFVTYIIVFFSFNEIVSSWKGLAIRCIASDIDSNQSTLTYKNAKKLNIDSYVSVICCSVEGIFFLSWQISLPLSLSLSLSLVLFRMKSSHLTNRNSVFLYVCMLSFTSSQSFDWSDYLWHSFWQTT
jgi:hypothetical protein